MKLLKIFIILIIYCFSTQNVFANAEQEAVKDLSLYIVLPNVSYSDTKELDKTEPSEMIDFQFLTQDLGRFISTFKSGITNTKIEVSVITGLQQIAQDGKNKIIIQSGVSKKGTTPFLQINAKLNEQELFFDFIPCQYDPHFFELLQSTFDKIVVKGIQAIQFQRLNKINLEQKTNNNTRNKDTQSAFFSMVEIRSPVSLGIQVDGKDGRRFAQKNFFKRTVFEITDSKCMISLQFPKIQKKLEHFESGKYYVIYVDVTDSQLIIEHEGNYSLTRNGLEELYGESFLPILGLELYAGWIIPGLPQWILGERINAISIGLGEIVGAFFIFSNSGKFANTGLALFFVSHFISIVSAGASIYENNQIIDYVSSVNRSVFYPGPDDLKKAAQPFSVSFPLIQTRF